MGLEDAPPVGQTNQRRLIPQEGFRRVSVSEEVERAHFALRDQVGLPSGLQSEVQGLHKELLKGTFLNL